VIPGADHSFSGHLSEVTDVVVDWVTE
jgi:hypothetical protein